MNISCAESSQFARQLRRFAPIQRHIGVTIERDNDAASFDSGRELAIAGDRTHINLSLCAARRSDRGEGAGDYLGFLRREAPRRLAGDRQCQQAAKCLMLHRRQSEVFRHLLRIFSTRTRAFPRKSVDPIGFRISRRRGRPF